MNIQQLAQELTPVIVESLRWRNATSYRAGWYARHQGQPYSRHNSRFWRAGWKASDREQATIQRVEVMR